MRASAFDLLRLLWSLRCDRARLLAFRSEGEATTTGPDGTDGHRAESLAKARRRAMVRHTEAIAMIPRVEVAVVKAGDRREAVTRALGLIDTNIRLRATQHTAVMGL